jgi:hypothetical protein
MKLAFLIVLASMFFLSPFGKTANAAECVPCTIKRRECGLLKNGCIGRCQARGNPLSAQSNPVTLLGSAGAG